MGKDPPRHQTDDHHPDGDDKSAKQDRADHYQNEADAAEQNPEDN